VGASDLVGDARWARAELLTRCAHWATARWSASLSGEVFRYATSRPIINVIKRHGLNAVECITTDSTTTATTATATSTTTAWAVLTECADPFVVVR
jgi:hypothetical protein